jgi:hypothetical protein
MRGFYCRKNVSQAHFLADWLTEATAVYKVCLKSNATERIARELAKL